MTAALLFVLVLCVAGAGATGATAHCRPANAAGIETAIALEVAARRLGGVERRIEVPRQDLAHHAMERTITDLAVGGVGEFGKEG